MWISLADGKSIPRKPKKKQQEMNVGFSGTREGMTDDQLDCLDRVLKKLLLDEDGDEFHHGQCIGADEEAADLAYVLGYKVFSHPPLLEKFKSTLIIPDQVELPPKSYHQRNRDIVMSCDTLVVAPQREFEEIRSGTWMAYRIARELQKRTIICWPNGTTEEVKYGYS